MGVNIWKDMTKFSGINNVDDPTRLGPVPGEDRVAVWPLVAADNVDIDNTGRLKKRLGYTKMVSLTRAYGLWADGDICLFVYQGTLYGLNTDYTYTSIRSGLLTHERLSYVRANDRVYYSNGTQIGYVDSSYTDHALSDPSMTFKYVLPAGKYLEFFRGRLYSAKGPVLSYSDVLSDYYDNRTNIFQFPSDIKMVLAVHGGLYVSDSEETHFLSGLSPTEMELTDGAPYPAVPHTGVKLNAQYIGTGGNGDYAIWTSAKGICVGDESGKIVNVTDKRYALGSTYREGAAIFDDTYGLYKYVVSLTN